jgi:hypothetical protein
MAQFPTLDNAAGVWKLQDVYNNVMDGTWPNNGAIGLVAFQIQLEVFLQVEEIQQIMLFNL